MKFKVKCKEYDQEVEFVTEVDNLDELSATIYDVRQAIYKGTSDVIDKVNSKPEKGQKQKEEKKEKPATDAQKKLLKKRAPMLPIEKIESLSCKEASSMIDELFSIINNTEQNN